MPCTHHVYRMMKCPTVLLHMQAGRRNLEAGQSPSFAWLPHQGLSMPGRQGTGQTSTTSSSTAGSATAEGCVVFEVASPSGAVMGQGLLVESWTYGDGRLGRPFVAPLAPQQVRMSSAGHGMNSHSHARAAETLMCALPTKARLSACCMCRCLGRRRCRRRRKL